MIFWLTTQALAGIPLVHEGGDTAALVAAASERTGLPADQFTPTEIGTIRDQGPRGLGDIAVRRCAREPSQNGTIRADLVRAEAAVGADDLLTAMDHLDLAVGELSCLTEVVDAAVAGRAFLLRGALSAEAGREDEARGEVRTAMAFESEVNWPAGYPVAAHSLVVEEIEGQTLHEVRVVPDPGLGPWIDGKEITDKTSLSEGLHLLQHSGPKGIRSAWLVVGGPGVVVVPDKFQAPILDAFVDPETRSDLEHLIAAGLDDFEAAYVTHQGGLWLVTEGPATSELVPHTPPPPPEPEPEPKGKKKKGKKG